MMDTKYEVKVLSEKGRHYVVIIENDAEYGRSEPFEDREDAIRLALRCVEKAGELGAKMIQ